MTIFKLICCCLIRLNLLSVPRFNPISSPRSDYVVDNPLAHVGNDKDTQKYRDNDKMLKRHNILPPRIGYSGPPPPPPRVKSMS